MRDCILKLISILYCLTLLFIHTELVHADKLPGVYVKNAEASFNIKNNKIEIFINSKTHKNINIRLTAGPYKYTLKSYISNLSFKKEKIHRINLIVNEKSIKENRNFVLKDTGKIKKVNDSRYNYRLHYKIPLKSLSNDLDSSAIINFKIIRPISRKHITTLSLGIPPWISILTSLICACCFSKYYLRRLKK